MNIFWLDEDMQKCAEYHCDKHVVKMLLESVQILSTALYLAGVQDVPYKPTHVKHPCVVWAEYCTGNFKKLSLLATKLSIEYSFRYGRVHKSTEALKEILKLTNMNKELPFEDHIESRPPLCVANPDPSADAVSNYREYYKEKLDNWGIMKYTKRDVPEFLI